MSLNKGIESGKEHRRAYRKSKAFDRSCRNHGVLRLLPKQSIPWL